MASFRPKSLRRRKSTMHSTSRHPSTSTTHSTSRRPSTSRSQSRQHQSRDPSPSKPTPLLTTQDARRAYLACSTPIVAPTGTVFTRGHQPRDVVFLPHPSVSFQPPSSPAPSPAPSENDFPLFIHDDDPPAPAVRPTPKRTTQCITWTTCIIPNMIPHYMRLLRKSESLQVLDADRRLTCTCGDSSPKVIRVLCVHFDGELP